MHRVQTLKEEARERSGQHPAIRIPDRPVPIPDRGTALTADEDDVATKILLKFINGKKGLARKAPKPSTVRRRQTTKQKNMSKKERHEDKTDTDDNDTTETTVGLRKRKNRVKLYVCGICSAQFQDKDSFMIHCQKLHVLPTVPNPKPKIPKPKSIEATLGPENVAEKAMKQLAILMKNDHEEKAGETNALNTSNDDDMIELIQVPDYDDDEEERFPLDSSCEVNKSDHLESVKTEELDVDQQANIEKPDKPSSLVVDQHEEDVKMETFIITTIDEAVDQPIETRSVTKIVTPATRSKSTLKTPSTTTTEPKATTLPNVQKPIFVPSKPTTRSSQKLCTPIRKSLRTAKKHRTS